MWAIKSGESNEFIGGHGDVTVQVASHKNQNTNCNNTCSLKNNFPF